MIGAYLTDSIKIVDTKTDKYGSITTTESAEIPARIEDDNKLLLDSNGKEVVSSAMIIIQSDQIIKYDDKIKIVKKMGESYNLSSKLFQIKKLSKFGNFTGQFYEVYI
jgi:hypothetical protein